MKLCFDFFDEDGRGRISNSSLSKTIAMFHKMNRTLDVTITRKGLDRDYEAKKAIASPQFFVNVMFEKARKMARPDKLARKFITTNLEHPCIICTKSCKRLSKVLVSYCLCNFLKFLSTWKRPFSPRLAARNVVMCSLTRPRRNLGKEAVVQVAIDTRSKTR